MQVDLMGGLGNQLFQYAFGRSVALARNEELFFIKNETPDRPYVLDAFNLPIRWAEGPLGRQRGEPVFKYDVSVYKEPNGLRYRGYWQTEKYFNIPIIRQEVKLNLLPFEFRSNCESVSIHVRRGDYTREPHLSFHGLMSLSYYERAADWIRARKERVKFYVFSNDPEWCRANFPLGYNIMDGFSQHEDLWLMSQCKHNIIANSSFSWWGAWLGEGDPNKIVVAPQQWFKDPNMQYGDVVPERWVKLSV